MQFTLFMSNYDNFNFVKKSIKFCRDSKEKDDRVDYDGELDLTKKEGLDADGCRASSSSIASQESWMLPLVESSY